jgi:phosphoserine phosphatase
MIRLVAFDFDGVIHEDNDGHSITLMHRAMGTDTKENLKYFAKLVVDFEKGRISYDEWGDIEAAYWKGRSISIMKEAAKKFVWITGAPETIKELKNRGYRLAIISSGGPKTAIAPLLEKMGFDHICMNDLGTNKDGLILGKWIDHVHYNKKREVLADLAKKENISLSECAVVGDNTNDRSMFRAAGFSIAFCAKDERVKRSSSVIVDKRDLREVLQFFPPPK